MQTIEATPAANVGPSVPAPYVIKTPAECKFARARQKGWNDFRAGREPRTQYEAKRLRQFAYERGRLSAATAKGMGCELALWRRTETYHGMLYRTLSPAMASKVIDATSIVRKRRKG